MPPRTEFARGIIQNGPGEDQIYMESAEKYRDKEMNWVACRGGIADWAIYIDWSNKHFEAVRSNGNKLRSHELIQKLVPCTEGALNRIR